jgi:hypothetical protein
MFSPARVFASAQLALWMVSAGACVAQPVATPLWARGYSVIPSPQQVTLGEDDIAFGEDWSIETGAGVARNHIAVRSLESDLRQWHGVSLRTSSAKRIRLSVDSGAGLRAQGYRLKIAPEEIAITGADAPGVFYGVQTLLQLIKADARGRLVAPVASIEDWPNLELRFLHWDTKNHQDRPETLKRYLDWAARFKVNMIGFELEDKFEYPSNPEIAAPGAFTTRELQELVNYGLERFIQIVPIIQAPAHLRYVLKHPKFAHLRADGNNYQACLCDPEADKLIFQMYDDVIAATRGVNYFFASTDEVYYAAAGAKCPQPDDAENRSRQWAEFAKRAHDHLASRGRRMLAWIEYPLLAKHLPIVPAGVIDGVVGDAEYVPIERQREMRQLIYVSLQGSEFLFPDHLPLERELAESAAEGPEDPLEFERGLAAGRLQSAFHDIAGGRARKLNPIGVFGSAWDVSGLHNVTFWLGWSAVAQYGWKPGTPSVEQHAAEFMNLYYGPGSSDMIEIYRTLQRQARAWQRTWDRVISKARGPGYGNSDGKGIGTARYDRTIMPPPLPEGTDLRFTPAFVERYKGYLAQAKLRSPENDQLVHSLQGKFAGVQRNRYNVEVLLALSQFIGHHWRLLDGLAEAERALAKAAAAKSPAQALSQLRSARQTVAQLEQEGSESFDRLTAVFAKSQYPKGRSVGGKKFFHVLDDTKDHWADRRADWSYMMADEQSIGLGAWRGRLEALIQSYAKQHGLRSEPE